MIITTELFLNEKYKVLNILVELFHSVRAIIYLFPRNSGIIIEL